MAVGERAVFIDKDGTLVENVPYNVDPQKVRLTNGALRGLKALSERGYRVLVISNQPGVALGLFEEQALKGVEERLRQLMATAGIRLEAFYYCPHHPQAGCGCRKPAAGLLERAARERGIDLEDSWMIGDILDDVEAGRRAGCRTVLLDVGNETEWVPGEQRVPHAVAGDLAQAAQLILEAR